MTHSKKNTKSKGFTLIELLVVVAIIGVLAAVGVVAFNGFINNSRSNCLSNQHVQLVKYVQTEFLKCNVGSTHIFGTTSGNTSSCISLAAGEGDPATDIGTFQKDSLRNCYDSSRTAFHLATNALGEINCTAGDAGCHYLEWEPAITTIKIYSYNETLGNAPVITSVQLE